MEESAACESKGTTHWWFYRVSFTRVFLAWDEMEMNNFNRAAKKKKSASQTVKAESKL